MKRIWKHMTVLMTSLLGMLLGSIAYCQELPLKFVPGENTGRRILITCNRVVPLRCFEQDSPNRLVLAGSIAKLKVVNGQTSAYDDIGEYEVGNDYVILGKDVESCLEKLKDKAPFTRNYALGNYYSLLNLSKARKFYEEALKTKPNDPFARYAYALAQSEPSKKVEQLNLVQKSDFCTYWLAKTRLAVLEGNNERLKEVCGESHCPQMPYLERMSLLLTNRKQKVQQVDIQLLVKEATAYGVPPRFMNLMAMLLRHNDIIHELTTQERITGALMYTECAITIDPWYHWALLTRADLYSLGKKYLKAAEDINHALVLNPLALDAMQIYLGVMKTPEVNTALSDKNVPGLDILRHHRIDEVFSQLSKTRHSDIPLATDANVDVYIHGFCPVNHGGKQPVKTSMLRKIAGVQAQKYLELAFKIDHIEHSTPSQMPR